MSVIEPVTNLDNQKDMEFNSTSDTRRLPNTETVIKVEGLSKKFCCSLKRSMFYGTIDIFRNMFGIPYNQGILRKNEFWALEDIYFELKKGETLGIIGVNGSGKSTLLRLITGIFPPDKGKITVTGRVGSLIAVGAGFHPHMTGRENIYLNGTILGMTKREIQAKFDSIVDFADIGKFLDAPVSTYSSGMRVRLGFAVAVHCEPDILLVDEVLSVGDLSFQRKCYQKINDLWQQNKSTIFVSHRLRDIERLCHRVIYLKNGKIAAAGDPNDVIRIYVADSFQTNFKDTNYYLTYINDNLYLDNVDIISDSVAKNNDGIPCINVFEDFYIKIEYHTNGKILDSFIAYNLYSQDNTLIGGRSFEAADKLIKWHEQGAIKIFFKNLRLNPGIYTINIRSRESNNSLLFDLYSLNFKVEDKNGLLKVPDKVSFINIENLLEHQSMYLEKHR